MKINGQAYFLTFLLFFQRNLHWCKIALDLSRFRQVIVVTLKLTNYADNTSLISLGPLFLWFFAETLALKQNNASQRYNVVRVSVEKNIPGQPWDCNTLSVLIFACIYFRELKKIVFREYLFSRMTSFWKFRVYKFLRIAKM